MCAPLTFAPGTLRITLATRDTHRQMAKIIFTLLRVVALPFQAMRVARFDALDLFLAPSALAPAYCHIALFISALLSVRFCFFRPTFFTIEAAIKQARQYVILVAKLQDFSSSFEHERLISEGNAG